MSALITQFGTIATSIFSQVSTVATTIVDTPLLLFTTGFLFVGGCIGIFGRLLSLFGGHYMDHIVNIMLLPFTSRTFFLIFPAACAFVAALFALISRLIRGDFRGISV